MFNWFKEKNPLGFKYINKELTNICQILENCDIINIRYDGYYEVYTFSNGFVMAVSPPTYFDSLIKIKDKFSGLDIYQKSVKKREIYELLGFLSEKISQYHYTISINNQTYNLAEFKYSYNDKDFIHQLSEKLKNDKSFIQDLCYNLIYMDNENPFAKQVSDFLKKELEFKYDDGLKELIK